MKILAIESSGVTASVALAEDETLIAEYTLNHRLTHSQTLLPMIDEIMKRAKQDVKTLDAVAVSGGPGSFTGLRIGSATAKGLGLALNIPVISVPTLEALAFNLYGASGRVCPVMDARREQVYTGVYRFEHCGLLTLTEQRAISLKNLADILNVSDEPVTFTGDGVVPYKEELLKTVDAPVKFAPMHMNRQRAGSLAALAFQYAARGIFESAAEHRPVYLRPSQAERERQKNSDGIRE